MNIAVQPDPTGSLFRIDSFECPMEQLRAFTDRLAIIHSYFDTLEGCLYNKVTVSAANDRVKIVTVVEWANAQVLQSAKEAVADFYAMDGFDPKVFMAERGIVGEFGLFREINQTEIV